MGYREPSHGMYRNQLGRQHAVNTAPSIHEQDLSAACASKFNGSLKCLRPVNTRCSTQLTELRKRMYCTLALSGMQRACHAGQASKAGSQSLGVDSLDCQHRNASLHAVCGAALRRLPCRLSPMCAQATVAAAEKACQQQMAPGAATSTSTVTVTVTVAADKQALQPVLQSLLLAHLGRSIQNTFGHRHPSHWWCPAQRPTYVCCNRLQKHFIHHACTPCCRIIWDQPLMG